MNNKQFAHEFVGSQKDGLPVFKTEDGTYFAKKADGTRAEMKRFRCEKTDGMIAEKSFCLMFGFDSEPAGAGSKNLNAELTYHT